MARNRLAGVEPTRGFESHALRHKRRFYAYFRIEPVFFFIRILNRIQFIVYQINRETGKDFVVSSVR